MNTVKGEEMASKHMRVAWKRQYNRRSPNPVTYGRVYKQQPAWSDDTDWTDISEFQIKS
jgi:hypothetical protein